MWIELNTFSFQGLLDSRFWIILTLFMLNKECEDEKGMSLLSKGTNS